MAYLNPVFIEFQASMVYRGLKTLDDVKPEYRDAVEQYLKENYPQD